MTFRAVQHGKVRLPRCVNKYLNALCGKQFLKLPSENPLSSGCLMTSPRQRKWSTIRLVWLLRLRDLRKRNKGLLGRRRQREQKARSAAILAYLAVKYTFPGCANFVREKDNGCSVFIIVAFHVRNLSSSEEGIRGRQAAQN